MTPSPDLSLTEWSVLGLIAEGDTYGFSIAKLFAANGPAGRIWTVARPLVYRAIDALTAQGLAVAVGSEPGDGGPRRTLVRVTLAGAAAITAWLDRPIEHVRDARSHLLMKLLLIHRRGGSYATLIDRQREDLAKMSAGLQRQIAAAEGFDGVIVRWRLSSVETIDHFLSDVDAGETH